MPTKSTTFNLLNYLELIVNAISSSGLVDVVYTDISLKISYVFMVYMTFYLSGHSPLRKLLLIVNMESLGDLTWCAQYLFVFVHDLTFADGLNSDRDQIELQEDLDLIIRWCDMNCQDFNIDKCNIVSFHKANSMKRIFEIWDDGNLIISQLLLIIDFIKNNAMRTLMIIMRKSVQFRDPNIFIKLYNSFSRPTLMNASQAQNPGYDKYSLEL